MNRREFLISTGGAALLAGCRSMDVFSSPELKFGVVSDIHITTRKSCRMFERALRYFRRRGVDAVVIPGDLTDWGLKSSLIYVKETWDRIFGNTMTVPLFCTGNHDYDGWAYRDMKVEMYANGYSEDENLKKLGMDKAWQDVFGVPFANVRHRKVNGYDFISCEYAARNGKDLETWMAANGGNLASDRPFFFFQHWPIRGTTIDSGEEDGKSVVKNVLNRYSNCIAITGHTHRPFIDERQIWQGEFTVVSAPSLSYACLQAGCENGRGDRDGHSNQSMQPIPTRRDLRGGQGFVFNVWKDRVEIERIDLEEGEEGAPDWVVPLPMCCGEKPYAVGVRDSKEPIPKFRSGAALDFETRNVENRSGHWTIVMNCEFPSARMPEGHRVLNYEIRAVPADGSKPLVKRFISPGYPYLPSREPETQRFWFDVKELPQDKDYVIEVRACNCFGAFSEPICSSVLHGKVATVEKK